VSAPPVEGEAPGTRLRDQIRPVLAVFVTVWLGWAALGVLAIGTIEPLDGVDVPGYPAPPVDRGWANALTSGERQDALWYLRIAADGYDETDGSAAFFPLYPLAIRLVATLPGVGPLAAATVIAQGSFFLALLLLSDLTRRELGEEVARRSVLLLAIFPTAFFFLVPYSEASFLLLSVAAFRFARQDRWGPAALAAAAAALTRSAGVLLFPALAIEALWQWREDGRALAPRLAGAFATLLGPLLTIGWWASQGAATTPIDAQERWGRTIWFPLLTLVRAGRLAFELRSYWLIDAVVVGVVLAAVIAGTRWLRPTWSVYAWSSLALPLFVPFPSRPLMSMPRFVVVVFPAIWVMARAVVRGRLPLSLVVGCSAAGWAVLGVLFTTWHYIF
jgi:hypothetical protein